MVHQNASAVKEEKQISLLSPVYPSVKEVVQPRQLVCPSLPVGSPCSNQRSPTLPSCPRKGQSLPVTRFIQSFVIWVAVAACCKPVAE